MARFSNPVSQYSDINGVPLPGSTLDFFEPGTTTRKDTFSDSGLTTANANPVVTDSDGRIPDIFLDGTYKVVLKNAAGSTIWTRDPVGDTTEGQFEAWLNDNTYAIPDLVKGSDNRFYRSITNANQGNDPTTSAANWEEIEFERIYNANVTYALGDRSIGSDGMEYFSLIASNLNNDPVTDATSTNWRAADQLRAANAAGTVDAITATFIPAVGALKNELMLRVRASGANATTTPTFAPNGLTAKTIVKTGNQALGVGDIKAAGHELLLVFNSSNDNWELLNPDSADTSLSNLSSTGNDKIAKAWVEFDGTSIDVTDSFNVTSITDNGVGDYTLNFTTALGDANYAVGNLGSGNNDATRGVAGCIFHPTVAPTTTAFRFQHVLGSNAASNGQLSDGTRITLIIFGA